MRGTQSQLVLCCTSTASRRLEGTGWIGQVQSQVRSRAGAPGAPFPALSIKKRAAPYGTSHSYTMSRGPWQCGAPPEHGMHTCAMAAPP